MHTTMQTLGRIALIGGPCVRRRAQYRDVRRRGEPGGGAEGRCLRPHLPDGARHSAGVGQRRDARPIHAAPAREAASRAGRRARNRSRLTGLSSRPGEDGARTTGYSAGACAFVALTLAIGHRRHSATHRRSCSLGSMAIITVLIYHLAAAELAPAPGAGADRHRASSSSCFARFRCRARAQPGS